MLLVGWRHVLTITDTAMLHRLAKEWGGAPAALPVYECPKCGQNDAGPLKWKRTSPPLPPPASGAGA
jgi:hypothetical protein